MRYFHATNARVYNYRNAKIVYLFAHFYDSKIVHGK